MHLFSSRNQNPTSLDFHRLSVGFSSADDGVLCWGSQLNLSWATWDTRVVEVFPAFPSAYSVLLESVCLFSFR